MPFCLETVDLSLTRTFSPTPFIPSDRGDRDIRCEDILSIQAMGLKKRLQHTHCSHAVIGISGGLDSTLALLVTARAYDLLGLDHSGIPCVTMPCFGTTDRTYQNALKLTDALGASLKEVRISAAVMQHFSDIGHDPAVHDVTYENSCAPPGTLLRRLRRPSFKNRAYGRSEYTGKSGASAAGIYDKETIYKWLRTFYYHFFSQQFKRSCLPDGPKVGSIAISPRGDLRMPSDADSALWMREMDSLK